MPKSLENVLCFQVILHGEKIFYVTFQTTIEKKDNLRKFFDVSIDKRIIFVFLSNGCTKNTSNKE